MFQLATLFMGLLATCYGASVTECKKVVGPLPINVEITGCDKLPCAVYKGKETGFKIHFKNGLKEKATILTARVKVPALGSAIPYPLPEDISNVCKNLANEQQCPLDVDADAIYDLLFPVGNLYPEVVVNIEIYIDNQNYHVLACFAVDIQVKKAK